MKKFFSLAASAAILILLFNGISKADSSEQAQVIKNSYDTNDLIIKRSNGEKWLIQYNRDCTSISTEFPVTLILNYDKIVSLKVNFNEICKVNYATQYSGEGTFLDVIRSDNQLVPDHVAEIIKDNNKYQIDYGKGCNYLYSHKNEKIYFHFADNPDKGGEMIMQDNQGHCPFTFTKLLETLPSQDPAAPQALEGVTYQAQNNQVYIYWNPVTANGKWLYAIGYSKFVLDLTTYDSWKDMPNVKIINTNQITVKNLANGTKYYFYLASMNEGHVAGPWTQINATPVQGISIKNTPDPIPFEVTEKETDTGFLLTWPNKADSASRYYVRLYVDGKLDFFKIVKIATNQFTIPKDPKYLGKGLLFSVKTIPLSQKPEYSDTIYWTYKK